MAILKHDESSVVTVKSSDPDGCKWTLDPSDKGTSLEVTCEKADGMSWPRITT